MSSALTLLRREVGALVPPGAVLHWLRDAAGGIAFAAVVIGACFVIGAFQ